MDHLMKLVLAALQWSYEAKATDVQEKWLEQAAELLVLRHDTFEISDGERGCKPDTSRTGFFPKRGARASTFGSHRTDNADPIPKKRRSAVRNVRLAILRDCSHSQRAFSREWCLAGGVSWLWESMDSFARWCSPALQIAQETENEHSQYWATMGQGKR